MVYTCQKCNKEYKTLRGFNNHVQKGCQPPKQKTYECSLCNITFKSSIELNRHTELDVCTRFLQNNTYCYPCHQEFNSHELLVQHEFSDQHLNIVRQGYTNVPPMSTVKNELTHIFQNGTIKEDQVFPITNEENEIMEELMEIEDALQEQEKELLKQKKKEQKKFEKEEGRQKIFDKIMKAPIKNTKEKKTKEKKVKNAKEKKRKPKKEGVQKTGKKSKSGIKSIDIGSFFQKSDAVLMEEKLQEIETLNQLEAQKEEEEKMVVLDNKFHKTIKPSICSIQKEGKEDNDTQSGYLFEDEDDEDPREIKIEEVVREENEKKQQLIEAIVEDAIKRESEEPEEQRNNNEIINIESTDTELNILESFETNNEEVEEYEKPKEPELTYEDKEIIQYNVMRRQLQKEAHYHDSVHNPKNYLGLYNINNYINYKLYQLIMSQQLPNVYTVTEKDKLNSSQMQSMVNNVLGTRQNDINQLQKIIQRNDALVHPQTVTKTNRQEFGNDMDLVIKNRSMQSRDIKLQAPPPPANISAGIALPQTDQEKFSKDEFEKKMKELEDSRNVQNNIIKEDVKNQKVDNVLTGDKLASMAIGASSSMDMSHMQKPDDTPDRNLCDVIGMPPPPPQQQPRQQPRQQSQPIPLLPPNPPEEPPVNFNGNQLSALNTLLGNTGQQRQQQRQQPQQQPQQQQPQQQHQQQSQQQSHQMNQNKNPLNINVSVDEEDYDLGNELQQVSVQLEREVPPNQQNTNHQINQKEYHQFQQQAMENMKLVQAKQMDGNIKNQTWIIMQRIINENNIDRNMMNLLVNCHVEDYIVIHQFINNSKQLQLERDKKQKLVDIFKKYVKFLGKKYKGGQQIIQGKSVKYMIDVLKNLKF